MTKVTCDPGSDDFVAFVFSDCPTVYLDGREVARARAADDVAGWVEFYPDDPRGCVRPCACGERAFVELAFGRVEIRGTLRVPRIVPGARP